MVLGMSYGEIIVIIGVGTVALGHKDIVGIARYAGLLTGRAAGYLSAARSHFASFSQNAELTKLHQDVQGTLSQLESIRAELQRGVLPAAASRVMQAPAAMPANKSTTTARASSTERSSASWQQTERASAGSQTATQAASQHAQQISISAKAPSNAVEEGASELRHQPGGSVGKGVVLPALDARDFRKGGNSSDCLITDQGFDAAAYAEYQSLFDVPAGQHAPTCLRHPRTDEATENQHSHQAQPKETGEVEDAMRAAVREEVASGLTTFLQSTEGQQVISNAVRTAVLSNTRKDGK